MTYFEVSNAVWGLVKLEKNLRRRSFRVRVDMPQLATPIAKSGHLCVYVDLSLFIAA